MKPRPPSPWIFWAFLALAVALGAEVFAHNPQDLDRYLINAALALSAFITLHARLLSLANAGFMAIGAYASAILVVKAGLPFGLALPGAILICGAVAVVIGLPVLRLKDVYLAIATLGFGEVIRILIILNPDLTGGPTGANLSTGFSYDAMKQTQTWMLVVFLFILVYLFFWLARSKTGRALRALRENPEAAATMGVNVVGLRVFAFLGSALIAGAAGAFYAHDVGSLDNSDFQFGRAVNILSFAVLGGSGHWLGPLLGAGILTALPIFLRDILGDSGFLKNFVQLPTILDGLALMLTIAFLPGGLISTLPLRKEKPARSLAPSRDHLPGLSPEGSKATRALLVLEDLGRSFGGLTALEALDFSIHPGKIYGLIGPNGAGKTTLVNLVTGLIRPSSGKIHWLEKEIQGLAPHRIARSGIARTFQNIRLFPEMNVLDNVIVGRHFHIQTNLATTWLRLPKERKEEARAHEAALALLDRLGLIDVAHRRAGTLPYGDQRRVEIARALAMEPRLLFLDEPAAGMNDEETSRLGDFILDLKRRGLAIVVIEHHMDLILSVCDEIVVLNFGKKIAEGRPEKISREEAVLEAYLGKN